MKNRDGIWGLYSRNKLFRSEPTCNTNLLMVLTVSVVMMGVGAPTEFSLDSVRQLMLAHGGRVTNHDLVKSFR